VDIHGKGQLPFVVADICYVLERGLVGGVVHEDVDPAQLHNGLLDELATMLGRLDVARYENSLPPGLFNPARRLSRVLILVEIGDQDFGALACEGDRNRPPDPAVASGDQSAFAPETTGSSIGLLTVIGTGVHGGGLTRHGLLLLRKGGLRIIGHRGISVFDIARRNADSFGLIRAKSMSSARILRLG
jgi:hypothetical protein